MSITSVRSASAAITLAATLGACALGMAGCGRAPSYLFRQGQVAVAYFPLYVTLGGPAGSVRKYLSDGSYTDFATGLNDPTGIAVDRFKNIYVAEQGANRLLKFNEAGVKTVYATSLLSPKIVALDGYDQVYVTQDGGNNVIRVSDRLVMRTFTSFPSGLAFGVNDLMIIGFQSDGLVYWGKSLTAETASVTSPVNVSIDMSGRVYVADEVDNADPNLPIGRVIRYQQGAPQGREVVATGLRGPLGIAVSSAQDIFVTENVRGKIVRCLYSGEPYIWAENLADPQYLAFTRY